MDRIYLPRQQRCMHFSLIQIYSLNVIQIKPRLLQRIRHTKRPTAEHVEQGVARKAEASELVLDSFGGARGVGDQDDRPAVPAP